MLVSCIHYKKVPKPGFDADWLIGSWTIVEDESITYETWTKLADQNYLGFGCTLVGSDTVFQEKMAFRVIDGLYNLIVTGVSEEPVAFTCVELTAKSFTCHNASNAFPTHIHYASRDDSLYARISGGEDQVEFHFAKSSK
jgi:hypothetical protein